MRTCLLLALLVLCAGCGDSRGTGGIQMGEEGVTFDTAAAAKRRAERTIVKAIGDEVGVTWRVGAIIAEEPAWNANDEHWEWGAATVAVTLAGSGDLGVSDDEVRNAVIAYLAKHQKEGAPAAAVTLRVERQAATTTVSGPTSAPTSAPAAPTEGWRYTIKKGDTLALISSAFYGTPEHWRRILDANPGLQPDQLQIDAVISVPPAP